MQNLACAVGVFTGYISDKGRRFSNIWCLGMICWLFHFIATSFVWVVVGGGGRVCICLTICSRVFSSLLGLYWYYKLAGWDSTELETSCSVCGPSYPFKGWLWDDDICWQKVCHQPSFWVPKNFQICCFIVELCFLVSCLENLRMFTLLLATVMCCTAACIDLKQ